MRRRVLGASTRGAARPAFTPAVLAEWHVAAGGYSHGTAADLDAVLQTIVNANNSIAAEPAFPLDHAGLFERRWRFGMLRLAAVEPGPIGR